MSVISKQSKTAIVLFNLGGPNSLQAVQPFLFNLFFDKAILRVPLPIRWMLARLISKKRAPVAQEIYKQLGGKSPILENTKAQADAIRERLQHSGNVEIFICMRYWHPMSEETVRRVKEYQPDHIILLPLYPQFSTTTTASSFSDWVKTAARQGVKTTTTTLCCYPTLDGWVEAVTDLLVAAYQKAQASGTPRILFSAHGLPEKIVLTGDPYQKQVEQTTQAVMEKMNQRLPATAFDYVNCYQSRVGPLKWIGPSTDESIIRAGEDKVPVVLVPIAFVSEHSETLVELDIEYKHLAEKHGVKEYIRVPTVSTHPAFIEGLANLCLSVTQKGFHCPWDGEDNCENDEAVTQDTLLTLGQDPKQEAA